MQLKQQVKNLLKRKNRMSKNYANEHPRNKKKNPSSNVKVASSKAAQKRKLKLQKLFIDAVEMREADYGGYVDVNEQEAIYKKLRLKILGRSD
jgi:hypothetical protein